jgi:ATP/ADP translocase
MTGIVSSSVTPLLVPSAHILRRAAYMAAGTSAAAGLDKGWLYVRGGAQKKVEKVAPLFSTPQGVSVGWMAAGMAMHYLGYSFARSITIALFTSASTGFPGSNFAFPLANAFVSPMSFILLLVYGRILESRGPRGALKQSTLYCAAVIILASLALEVTNTGGMTLFGFSATKFITAPLFIFRESYVQLLTSQYWSFMASVLTPDQSAKWFAPIAGLTSIASATGGILVRHLTSRIGLSGTMACTGVALCLSLVATELAYTVADKNGFTPTQHSKKGHSKKGHSKKGHSKKGHSKKDVKVDEKVSIFSKAQRLFKRVPVLRALFFEILASQGLATLLNVCFVKVLATSITDDNSRAGWVGNFYALINIITMALQFGVLPLLMRVLEPKDLWRVVPLISLVFTTFQAFQENPSLYVVAGSLLVMKFLEYSARRMLDEMVYVPLDFESRFVGKEIIGVFGYRLGKSLMSLSLSALTSAFGDFNLQTLSILCDVAGLAWAKTAWDLSSLVMTRKEAQDSYDAVRK